VKRRELLQLCVATGLGALEPPAASAICDARELLSLRVTCGRAELAPGLEVPALICNGENDETPLWRNSRQPVVMEVANQSGLEICLRAPWLDRDLHIAAGARARAIGPAMTSRFDFMRVTSGVASLDALSGVAGLRVPSDTVQDHDQEHYLPIQHWLPALKAGTGAQLGFEIAYRHATLGNRLLNASEPIRVREGDRVRFHFVNASPTKCVTLALPHHRFEVVALDGYPVARMRAVKHVFLGPGERVEAVVDMLNPGRWVLGSIDRREREGGFGRLVEYARCGSEVVHPPFEPRDWNYCSFGNSRTSELRRARSLPMMLTSTRANTQLPSSHSLDLRVGLRHRLSMINMTGECQPFALRRQDFSLVTVAGATAGDLRKDTLMLPSFARSEIEFVARHPAVELLHGRSVSVARMRV
jgi:Multicopper oxidase